MRRQSTKSPCGKRGKAGFIEYIAADDERISRGCTPDEAYNRFVKKHKKRPQRMFIVESNRKGAVNAWVIESYVEK